MARALCSTTPQVRKKALSSWAIACGCSSGKKCPQCGTRTPDTSSANARSGAAISAIEPNSALILHARNPDKNAAVRLFFPDRWRKAVPASRQPVKCWQQPFCDRYDIKQKKRPANLVKAACIVTHPFVKNSLKSLCLSCFAVFLPII